MTRPSDRAGDWRPGGPTRPPPRPGAPGVRVVIDLRPLQDPERAPLTAAYLEALLDALDADPRPGESFSFLLAADLDGPDRPLARTSTLAGDPAAPAHPAPPLGRPDRRPVPAPRRVDRRRLARRPRRRRPRHRLSRRRRRPADRVAASRSSPRCSTSRRGRCRRPTRAARSPGSASGSARACSRTRGLVLVPSRATRRRGAAPAARRARRACGWSRSPRGPHYRPEAAAGAAPRARAPRASGERYAVYAGRYDARQDLPTLFAALAALAEEAAAGRRSPDGALAAARVPRGRHARATAPRCRARPCARASRTRSRTRRACPTTASPRSSPGPGSSSSPCAPRRPGSPRSTRSPPGCRSSRARRGAARGRRAGRRPRRAGRSGAARDRDPRGLVGRRPARRRWSPRRASAPTARGRGRTSRARRARCGPRSRDRRRCSSRRAERPTSRGDRPP